MNAPLSIDWETLDLDAPYPDPVYRAVVGDEVATIARWIRTRDRKYDRGRGAENWTLTFMGGVGYFPTLDDATAAAEDWATNNSAHIPN